MLQFQLASIADLSLTLSAIYTFSYLYFELARR
jgi:hypothetical protein